jgi:hypothetical protein
VKTAFERRRFLKRVGAANHHGVDKLVFILNHVGGTLTAFEGNRI